MGLEPADAASERSAFRLTRRDFPPTREGLAALAQLRREEIEGFVEGLFGEADHLDLPERAHKALGVLAEMRALLEGAQAVAEDRDKPAPAGEIAKTMGHLREMTGTAEHEMHEAVLSCTRARRRMLAACRRVCARNPILRLNGPAFPGTVAAAGCRPHGNRYIPERLAWRSALFETLGYDPVIVAATPGSGIACGAFLAATALFPDPKGALRPVFFVVSALLLCRYVYWRVTVSMPEAS